MSIHIDPQAKNMGSACRFKLRICVKCGKPIVSWHPLDELIAWALGRPSFRLCEGCVRAMGLSVSMARKRTLVREDN